METLSLDYLSAELNRSVLDADEFIGRFKDLAAKLHLPGTDEFFQLLEPTELLICSYWDIARRVANHVREGPLSPEEETALLELIEWATWHIRRAGLTLMRQIFRLDDMLGKKAAQRNRQERFTAPTD